MPHWRFWRACVLARGRKTDTLLMKNGNSNGPIRCDVYVVSLRQAKGLCVWTALRG
jgi:hypothetical protein